MTNSDRSPGQLEHELRTWLTDARPVLPDRDARIAAVLERLDDTPQSRRRILGRWLQRDEGATRAIPVRHPPPETETRRNPSMLSATASVAVLAALAITASLVVSPKQPYAPVTGQTLVVAADGSAEIPTITEAVAAAADGDTILVRPGLYTEAIVIEKDIALRGDGPVAEIVIEAPEDGPTIATGESLGQDLEAAYALLLVDSEGTVSGLTLRGQDSRVHVRGGSPTLVGLVLQGVGTRFKGPLPLAGGLIIVGSAPTIRGSAFEGGNGINAYDRSEPLVLDNVFRDGAGIAGDFGDGAVIRGNRIAGTLEAIAILRPTTALIEGNTIDGAAIGITVGNRISRPIGDGVDPVIRGNTISGSSNGISLERGAAPTIERNILVGNSTAINLSSGGPATVVENDLVNNRTGIAIGRSSGRVEGNTIRGGTTGVSITDGATATLAGNTIVRAASHGVIIHGYGTSPTLTANRLCDNGTNLFVQEGLEPVMQDNDICPDGLAEATR